MVLIVYLPQRFQIPDGLTPVASGIRMPTPGQARTIIKASEATAQV
jgi:hypothetical protein